MKKILISAIICITLFIIFVNKDASAYSSWLSSTYTYMQSSDSEDNDSSYTPIYSENVNNPDSKMIYSGNGRGVMIGDALIYND